MFALQLQTRGGNEDMNTFFYVQISTDNEKPSLFDEKQQQKWKR